ncbi:hypothetical protein Afil01_07650 [Actinorhabdospora filicis]|uniref:Uncharacterized protein n=1 Tax=Actinorhabdospora filicis TaxID=1785913 RepID=A0A9W6SH87_9ACTN|nr:hypothetical protein Afil01_07650 [Actinorhabdospora filicis]
MNGGLGDAAVLYGVWLDHAKLPGSAGYMVCTDPECREGWPCTDRQTSEAGLLGLGIDPYAVLRSEAVLPTGNGNGAG